MYTLEDMNLPYSSLDIYNSICTKIISNELAPGTKISEKTLCDEFRVSRSVVRTAVARLQQIHLLRVFPQRGIQVALLDIDLTYNATKIRHAIEREAVYFMFKNTLSDKLLNDLKVMLCEMKKLLKTPSKENIAKFKSTNAVYHLRIIQEVFSAKSLSLIYEVRIHMARWSNIDVSLLSVIDTLYKYNEAIYEAMASRHLQDALSAIHEHYECFVGNMHKVKENYPEYFSTKQA